MKTWLSLLTFCSYIILFFPPLLFGLWLNRIWSSTRNAAFGWLALGIGWFPLLSLIVTMATANLVGPNRPFDLPYNSEGYRLLQLWIPHGVKFFQYFSISIAIVGFYGYKTDLKSLIKPLRGMHVEE